ncbi:MAG: FHA domain-containing protein [Verrucomicrobiota bacterium]|nr:FHA domain-containing protein [Verrucomicrobiota bacterium]|tara:strand:- start:1336 stop:1638 length:303 start_codon:yes stop_codon:yes gene_type:complete
MQISYSYQGKWRIRSLTDSEVVVGRPNSQSQVHIDLSPDTTVSRVHAKIWMQDGTCWIQDMESKYGTQVNGEKLEGIRQLQVGDTIVIGETMMRIDYPQK